MIPVLTKIIEHIASPENRALLAWESFWYSSAAKEGRFAEDTKRETLPLKLSASGEEIGALAAALGLNTAQSKNGDHELTIAIADAGRQPTTLVISSRKHTWLPASTKLDGDVISVAEDASLKDILQVAILAARYPQLHIHHEQSNIEYEELPQTVRRHAFRNIIAGRKPSAGLRLLDAFGLLEKFLPEVTAGRGLAQNRFHAHDIFEHLLRSVDGALDLNEPVRWSALLHDIGKVPTRVETANGEASFHNHEMYSARMIVPIMKRLAVPIGVGQKVKFLVRNHMFHYTDEWSDKAVRRFVKKVPLDELQDLISLRLADRKGSGKKTAFPKALQKLIGHIDEIIAKEKEFKIKDLAIDGHALMEMGMPPSKAMGDMLKFLFEEVKAGRAENSADALAHLAATRLGVTAQS